MTTRADINRWVARYLKRSDYTDQDITDAIETATKDIGNQLRDDVNKTTLIYAAGDVYPVLLPLDHRGVETIETDVTGGVRTLSSVDSARLNAIKAGNASAPGGALVYSVDRALLDIAPAPTGEVRHYYFAEPEAITEPDQSTNAVLERYPQLYRYRILSELALMNQDVKLARELLQLYAADLETINARYKMNSAGDAPARRRR